MNTGQVNSVRMSRRHVMQALTSHFSAATRFSGKHDGKTASTERILPIALWPATKRHWLESLLTRSIQLLGREPGVTRGSLRRPMEGALKIHGPEPYSWLIVP